MTAAADVAPITPGWLRGGAFDLGFIVGIAALALASGALAAYEPRWFTPILVTDLWLLGYHHVVTTFTRLCFDRASLRAHRFLITWLPLIVLCGVAALAAGAGLWLLASVYLYWQWFHYTRQSYGIAQVYRRKAGPGFAENPWLTRAAIYLLPLWGIVHRSHQDPGEFLFMELRVIPVPEAAVTAAGFAAGAALAWWLVSRARMAMRGHLPVAHTLYMLSHFAIFYVGYLAIEDITHGWLVLNVWHNAQYIAFVWIYNNNRFKGGVDRQARFLSTISQTRNWWLYFPVCVAISTLLYKAVEPSLAALIALAGLPAMPVIVIYMTVNFHHYIVDGVIWKLRRKPLQRTLGIA